MGEVVTHAAILMVDESLLQDPEIRDLVEIEMRALIGKYIDQTTAGRLNVLGSEDPNLVNQIRNLRLSPPLNVTIK